MMIRASIFLLFFLATTGLSSILFSSCVPTQPASYFIMSVPALNQTTLAFMDPSTPSVFFEVTLPSTHDVVSPCPGDVVATLSFPPAVWAMNAFYPGSLTQSNLIDIQWVLGDFTINGFAFHIAIGYEPYRLGYGQPSAIRENPLYALRTFFLRVLWRVGQ